MRDAIAKSRWTSAPVATVVIMTYFAMKAMLCTRYGPDVAMADAVVLVLLALITFRGGVLYGAVIATVAPIVNATLTNYAGGTTGLMVSNLLRELAVCETIVMIVAIANSRERRAGSEATAKADGYRRKLYMLEKQSSIAIEDAQSNTIKHKRDVDRYSSLVVLLHEAAEKLSASLDTGALIQTLFLVLDQSFRACRASVYLVDNDADSLNLLEYYSRPERGEPVGILHRPPEEISTTDPFLLNLAKVRRAVYVPCPDLMKAVNAAETQGKQQMAREHDPIAVAPDIQQESRFQALISGALYDKGHMTGVVNIQAMEIDRDFDLQRDTELLSMICDIGGIALSNADLFAQVQFLAERDSLTGLYNRRCFFEKLAEAMGTIEKGRPGPFGISQRQHDTTNGNAGPSIAVIMCDLDHFKRVNDTYGHQAGDEVLKHFINTCTRHAGDDAVIARYGGEEFVIMLPHADYEKACLTAEKIRKATADTPCDYNNQSIALSASMGVAVAPLNGETVEDILRTADRALYTAKESGRNRVVKAEDSALIALGASIGS